nr:MULTISPECIES: transposase [unclassified Halomonas]
MQGSWPASAFYYREQTLTQLHRVDSPKGKETYSHRMSVVEPVFGNIGTTKRLNRFSLRGKKKVQGQWQLILRS